jgi:hypothetical protein
MKNKKLPQPVQEAIGFLDVPENANLATCDIAHVYPSKQHCYPDDYQDMMWFDVVVYDYEKKERRKIKNVNRFITADAEVRHFGVYADGSFFVEFEGTHSVINGKTFVEVETM